MIDRILARLRRIVRNDDQFALTIDHAAVLDVPSISEMTAGSRRGPLTADPTGATFGDICQ